MNTISYHEKNQGFTILELVISMGIFISILSIGFLSLQVNEKTYVNQQIQSLAVGDLRQSVEAVKNNINKSAYIYPMGIKITVTSGLTGREQMNTVTTGSNALVLLMSRNDGDNQYDGRIFYLANRSSFIGSSSKPSQVSSSYATPTNIVLVEARTQTPITWTAKTLPTSTAVLALWSATVMQEAVMAENIDVATTNLFENQSTLAYGTNSFDSPVFDNGIEGKLSLPTGFSGTNALISGVRFTIALARSTSGSSASSLTSTQYVLARNIPRVNY